MSAPLWITEADVTAMMDISGAINALEAALLAEARGDAQNMVKTHVAWGGGDTLHAIGAAFPAEGVVGTKTWAHTHGGATPLLILFDSHDGSLRAVLEAFALGQLRTGAASAVATRWLAAADADELAMIGTGKQAITQVAAIAAVRRLRRVRVFGPTPERRAQFAARVRQELGLEAVEAQSVRQATEGAPIVTLATRATAPFLTADMLAGGAHVNAIGAIVPSRSEFSADVLQRATCVVADSVPSAQRLARELIDFYGPADAPGWHAVLPLASIVAQQRRRGPHDTVTVFKSLGMGISDLALAIALYREAVRNGRGRTLEAPRRVLPQLAAQKTTA